MQWGRAMRRVHLLFNALLGAALACGFGAMRADAADSQALYVITKSIPLGAPDRWDYVTYDSTAHRIYAAHGTSITVVDARSAAILGSVPVPGANGVAVVPSIGKGYAGSSTTKSVLVFDLSDFKVRKKLSADEDTDAVVYDPFSKRVFVMEGDPKTMLVIDTGNDSVVTKIALHGSPNSRPSTAPANSTSTSRISAKSSESTREPRRSTPLGPSRTASRRTDCRSMAPLGVCSRVA